MLARVTLQTPDGQHHELVHGDLVGRLWSARLCLSDPRVSEAHAMVSLRGGELKLLALRGLFAAGGKPRKDLVLRPGQVISFARGLDVRVVDVVLPARVMGIEGPGLPRQPLPGSCSLLLDPHPVLAPRVRDGHAAAFWSTGDGWLVQEPGQDPAPLVEDWSLSRDGAVYRAVPVILSRVGQTPTQVAGAVAAPLRLELHWDTVHLHRDGAPTLTLSGNPARLLSELAAVGTAVDWEEVAGAIWTDGADRNALRKRFDNVLLRLRRKLAEAGVRKDLVRSDGAGNIALVLRPEDRVDDRS